MGLSNYLPSSRISQSGVCTSTTRPSSPYEGQVIYETDTNKTFVWSGSAWVMLVSADSPPGLELVKTQTVGSAVSSVEVTGAFSSTYDNYEIHYVGGTVSSNTSIAIRFGSSETGYYSVLAYSDVGATLTSATNNNASQLNWIGGGTANQAATANCLVMGPYLSGYTRVRNGGYVDGTNYGITNGEHRVASSYTSFKLLPNGGVTMTGGTIRVYGYRNSI